MHKSVQLRTLANHFFRLFFVTDMASAEGSAETPIVRALAGVATPALMAGFWIALLARNVGGWRGLSIHYFFVIYAFSAMGCITTLQWETLFPARTDFLILLPLPLRPATLFAAKLRAVCILLGLFLFAAIIGGTLLLPTLAGWSLPRAMLAHAFATLGAGLVAALAVLTLEAVVIVITPERWFRAAAFFTQTVLISGFITLFLKISNTNDSLRPLLTGTAASHAAAWFPPLWFAAVYESILGGPTSTELAHHFARLGLSAIPLLLGAVALTYPAAWFRRKRMALEGTQSARLRDSRIWIAAHRMLLQDPDQRAVFHFIRQTLTRLDRYRVLLSAYCGAGIACSLSSAVAIDQVHGTLRYTLWKPGVQAAMPLLLFWTVAGLRVAFLLPDDLGARWIFRIAPLQTRRVVSTTKLLVLMLCSAVVATIAMALMLCGWSATDTLQQVFFGCIYALLLTDFFFFLESSLPFTRPRMPGQNSLPLTLAVFVFGAPVSVLLALTLERWAAHHALRVLAICAAPAAIHLLQRWLRSLPSHSASSDVFLGENDTDVQTLGLST